MADSKTNDVNTQTAGSICGYTDYNNEHHTQGVIHEMRPSSVCIDPESKDPDRGFALIFRCQNSTRLNTQAGLTSNSLLIRNNRTHVPNKRNDILELKTLTSTFQNIFRLLMTPETNLILKGLRPRFALVWTTSTMVWEWPLSQFLQCSERTSKSCFYQRNMTSSCSYFSALQRGYFLWSYCCVLLLRKVKMNFLVFNLFWNYISRILLFILVVAGPRCIGVLAVLLPCTEQLVCLFGRWRRNDVCYCTRRQICTLGSPGSPLVAPHTPIALGPAGALLQVLP